MLLPQGTAFHTLRKRLAVVSSASVLGQLPSNTESDTLATRSPPVFDFQEMLQQYRETKERQREYLVQRTLASVLIELAANTIRAVKRGKKTDTGDPASA